MKARDVIRAIAAKHNLQPRDLLGHDRFGHFIEARREAAQTLRAMGHSYTWIGRQMNRDHTTIIQHCNPKLLAPQSQQGGPRMTRCASNNILQIFAPDVRKWIEDQARAERVKPETIIRERMRELAEHEKAARAVS